VPYSTRTVADGHHAAVSKPPGVEISAPPAALAGRGSLARTLGGAAWGIAIVFGIADGDPSIAFVLIAGFYVTLLAHELGHAAAAIMVRVHVVRVDVGTGPSVGLISRRVRLGLLPGGGACIVEGTDELGFVRARVAIFGLGGCLANFALIVALAHWAPTSALATAITACSALTFLNLVPVPPFRTRGLRGTDGWVILRALVVRAAAEAS
jgi:hypothetical protein